MWERFWSDFSSTMLMTDPLAYGLYLAWCLEDQGHEELAVAPQPVLTREPLSSTVARTHLPAPAAAR
jgi:hypothetical protein